jgi:hypothetical protein
MNTTFLSASLIALWSVVLVLLLLTMRVLRRLRAEDDLRSKAAELENAPPLPIGAPAPDFRARKLSGEPARLADYAGRAVAFIFVSPRCGQCRSEVRTLNRLAPLAKRQAGVELILVSDRGAAETSEWIIAIREEDGVEVPLQILVATSDLLRIYNPHGLLPYYCLIDEQGIVQARDPLGMGKWPELQRSWEGGVTAKPFAWLTSRDR